MTDSGTPTLKLHLGCGERYIPGWTHIDIESWPHVDHVHDIRSLPMIEDSSVDLIYACQVLAYFDVDEVKGVLREWRRVLKWGGVLRLSLPNFKVVADLYRAGLPLEWFLGTLYGKRHLSGNPNPVGGDPRTIYHRTTYDKQSITSALTEAGFGEVREWDWRSTEHSDIDDLSQAYFPHMAKYTGISWNLNIEGRKLHVAATDEG